VVVHDGSQPRERGLERRLALPLGRVHIVAAPEAGEIVPELRGRPVLASRSGGPMSPAARVLVEKGRRLLSVGADA
jgi:hypothetical protein